MCGAHCAHTKVWRIGGGGGGGDGGGGGVGWGREGMGWGGRALCFLGLGVGKFGESCVASCMNVVARVLVYVRAMRKFVKAHMRPCMHAPLPPKNPSKAGGGPWRPPGRPGKE